DLQVAVLDLNRLVEAAGSEIERMPEAVRRLGAVFAEEARGRVAVIARGDGAMGRFQPAVILLTHNMAIGSSRGGVHQVRLAFGVNEGIDAQSDRRAD